MESLRSKGLVVGKDSVTLEQIIKDVRRNPDFGQAGDILSFTGTVRETSLLSDKKVHQIEIQAYKELADKQLTQICKELISQYELIDARVIHYTGFFNVGEPLVNCVVASKHRKEGFRALNQMIEEYKHRAYIFKCEIYTDGSLDWISTEKTEEVQE
ncbi:MAG: molybdenum cofactor biosynthesis protein MoaE [Candidatus Hodarchaeales archaeon]